VSERLSGTITFLFTDIEGSTALLKRVGRERYADVLAVHQGLLRDAFAAHGGDEIDTEGDSFFVAFRSASEAVAAAAAAQRGLAAHAWLDGCEVRVRMGIHSGEAAAANAGYLGLSVHRAARVAAVGHGGQVLLSSTTRELVDDDLPPGVSLRDLGSFDLTDIDRPERLTQLVIEGLPSEFPPLKATALVERTDRLAEPDERHYWLVSGLIADGFVVPFLGAGASLCDRPPGAEWEPGRYLPSGGELARLLADRSRYPDAKDGDLLRVSQYVDAILGEGRLYGYLRSVFNADYPPNSLHRFLASLPSLYRERGLPQQLIITTNYDDLLERAYLDAGEACDVVWYEAKKGSLRGRLMHRPPGGEPAPIDLPNKYTALSLEERPVVLKLHGAVDRTDAKRDSYVITEDNYIDYLSVGDIGPQIPMTLRERMADSHFLFLGYSMRDWNLRVILNRIWGEQQLDLKSWAVQLAPTDAGGYEIEQTLWRHRGDVDLLYAPLAEYIGRLVAEIPTLPVEADA
jgi:class 3 adenylate cyclase